MRKQPCGCRGTRERVGIQADEPAWWLARLLAVVIVSSLAGLVPASPLSAKVGENSGVTLPAGTVLYLRLETPVSTTSSHLHAAVAARVVRDVPAGEVADHVAIPIGALVKGSIQKLIPTSSPTDRARLTLRFDQLEIPGRPALAIEGHILDVENAREMILPDGTVQGVLASELPLTMLEGALGKLAKTSPSMGGEMQKTAQKNLGKSDTSINYPAGTDFSITLDKPVVLEAPSPATTAAELPAGIAEPVERLLAEAPQRAAGKDGKPGDPLNLIFIGNADQIHQAFEQAGWAEAEKLTGKSVLGTVRAVMGNQGYGTAPVSQLYLYGRAEDMAFQKMLNTFAKRHHLRVWRTPATTADGREIWFGAATHDVGWDIRPGVVSHAIDPEIDQEREKVGADLAATGHVRAERLVARPNPLSEGLTATGATWKTDGRLRVIELKAQ
ncbi:MAG: LssY C-terminal domain-containing protein [Acidobacteriia bacterium]|nr:LssY C-terminal domain-containing protein [Terriglobia bacterium]